jgi:hypothetical protein
MALSRSGRCSSVSLLGERDLIVGFEHVEAGDGVDHRLIAQEQPERLTPGRRRAHRHTDETQVRRVVVVASSMVKRSMSPRAATASTSA